LQYAVFPTPGVVCAVDLSEIDGGKSAEAWLGVIHECANGFFGKKRD
jgi:hypothetical protein